MTWAAMILSLAAVVVLAAVAASGVGPAASLRRTVARFSEVSDELDGLRRGLDRLGARGVRGAGASGARQSTT